MGSANFRQCRRRSPWIAARSRRSVLHNSRSRSRSMSRNRHEYRMGMHVNRETGEYDQVDVFNMITAVMGRCLIEERNAIAATTTSVEKNEVEDLDIAWESNSGPDLAPFMLSLAQRSWAGECCACRKKIITRTFNRESMCYLCQHRVCNKGR